MASKPTTKLTFEEWSGAQPELAFREERNWPLNGLRCPSCGASALLQRKGDSYRIVCVLSTYENCSGLSNTGWCDTATEARATWVMACVMCRK